MEKKNADKLAKPFEASAQMSVYKPMLADKVKSFQSKLVELIKSCWVAVDRIKSDAELNVTFEDARKTFAAHGNVLGWFCFRLLRRY